MKKFTALCVLLLCAALLAGCSVYAEPVFTDVSGGVWYYDTVMRARDLGLVGGYPDGSFRPGAQVSYAEFLKMAAGNSERLPGGHWASGIFADARSRGLFSAADFSASQLDAPIPRKHMALVSANLLREAEKVPAGSHGEAVPQAGFTDVGSADRYEYYVSICAAAGIIGGYPDGSFRPDKGLTRAEAAAVCVRLYDALNGSAAAAGADEEEAAAVPTAEELMDPGARQLARAVLESARFEGGAGLCRFVCSQPEIPDEYHLKISLEVFENNGEGTPSLFRWVSDEGWLADPANYDPSAHASDLVLSGVSSPENKAVFLEILVTNSATREMASYYLKQEFDGSRSLTAVYDPPAGAAGVRVINTESAEGYFNWK
jgi:hypothetical protein